VEEYRTEEEQVEALRRWWNENGRSTIVAIIVALGVGFGWQGWKSQQQNQQEQASNIYQALLKAVGAAEDPEQRQLGITLVEQLKTDYAGTTYAQFAALHMAAIAVTDGDLAEAEVQLRWVLGKATAGSDTAQVAQMRLARVLASAGDTDQALAILEDDGGSYQASYAAARGDILLAAGRNDEAREAYNQALVLAAAGGTGINLPALQQKLQSLTPIPGRELESAVMVEQKPGDTAETPANDGHSGEG
jgi:predicted negative regulator of RcsB-dependent stress response